MKIDVMCPCLTKPSKEWMQCLSYLPVNKLILEHSKPISIARCRAIQKVETEYFMSIDSDVFVSKHCFHMLLPHILDKKVGAVSSKNRLMGFGKAFDDALNESLRGDAVHVLGKGERAEVINCALVRKECVEDFFPPNYVGVLEDQLIGEHVFKKGYLWIVLDIQGSIHLKSWISMMRGSIWAGKTEIHYLGHKKFVKKTLKCLMGIPYFTVKMILEHKRIYVFNIVQDFFYLLGAMFHE